MTVAPVSIPAGKQSFIDPVTGLPLAFGLIYLYVPFTTTPKPTWADEALAAPNTQPILLDAAGQCSIWGTGLYRQVVTRANGTQLWDVVTGYAASASTVITGPALSTPGHIATWADAAGSQLADGGPLGSLAVLNTINNANWSGTDLAIANGGTGASDAPTARSNLGLVIGTNVQAFDAKLASLAGLSPSGDQVNYWTSGTTLGLFTFTAFMRGVAGSADAATARAALAAEPSGQVLGINTQAASYTLVLTDAGKVVEVNTAGASNLTIPTNASVAFPINTRIDLVALGAGQVTVVAAGGVTIRSSGAKLKLTGQYSGACLYKRGTDEWVLMGDLST